MARYVKFSKVFGGIKDSFVSLYKHFYTDV